MRAPAALLAALLTLVTFPLAAFAEEPPLALNDPGGQGLTLEKLDVRVAAHGPLALTELEMVFRNPQARRIEGKLVCALPAGATVSRFAKEVNGELVEGEVVERLRATQVYTEILHSMQDPALLEQDAGNRFRARIFPIEANAAVRVIIAYSTVNPVDPKGTRRITVPLRGMSRIGHLKLLALCRPLPGELVQLADASGTVKPLISKDKITFAEEMERKDFQPTEDLALTFQAGPDAKPAARLVAGDFQIAMFRPPAPQTKEAPKATRVLVLADTSASQADGGPARLNALGKVLEQLEAAYAGAAFTVEAFDITVAPVLSYKGGEGKAAAVTKAIGERHFLGATDMALALKRAGDWARSETGPALVVVASDAISTFGTKETGDVVRSLGAWPENAMLHVLSIGSVLDASAAQAVAEAGHGRVVTLALNTDWEANAKAAGVELQRPRGADFQAYDEGAEWIEPRKFADTQGGAELVTFSKRKAGTAAEVGVTAGKGHSLAAGEAVSAPEWAPLIEREAYRAQLAYLEKQENETQDAAKRAALRKERVEISVKHRVLCPLTSLLVLENEGEFAKYGIDRRALADIMVVGKSGIELKKREGKPPAPKQEEPTARAMKDGPRKKMKAGGRHTRGFSAAAQSEDGAVAESKAQAAPMDSGDDGLVASEAEAPAPGSARRDEASADLDVGGQGEGYGSGGGGAAADSLSGMTGRSAPTAGAAPGLAAPPPPPAAAPMMERASQPRAEPRAPAATSARATTINRVEMSRTRQRRANDAERLSATQDIATEEAQPEPAPEKLVGPSWTRDAGSKPTAAILEPLRKAVAARPQDRAARNKLAFELNRARENQELLAQAFSWQPFDPDNPMVYEYAGDAYTRLRDSAGALRAYSSIAEVSPGESGLLNRAGFMCLRAGEAKMAETLFRFAIERRPDHANNYRGLELALWAQGRYEDAVKALEDALKQDYHGRYGNITRILKEELGYVLNAWIQADANAKKKATELAKTHDVDLSRSDALRTTLHWETDANDVDLHIVDPRNEECYYQHKQNASGLNLYEDLTQGLGPETATVPPGKLLKGVYHVGVTYFAAGPMGVSRGVVVIQKPGKDGKQDLQIETFCLLPDAERGQDLRHVAVVESAAP